MKRQVICFICSLISASAFAGGPLDAFVGTYTLQTGTQGMNSSGDIICPSPLIFSSTLTALDSNMPQLPELQVASTEDDNKQFIGVLSADGTTFTYKQVTKSHCFLGFFCSTSTLEGTLDLTNNSLSLTHSESTSANGVESAGTCYYTTSSSPSN